MVMKEFAGYAALVEILRHIRTTARLDRAKFPGAAPHKIVGTRPSQGSARKPKRG